MLSPYVANHWFVKRRGLAVGILTASTATGQLILLPVLAIIIEHYSWRWAMGLILLLSTMMFVMIAMFIKNKPQDIGLTPYGHDEIMGEPQVQPKKNPISMAFLGLAEAVKVKAFWLLAGSFFICGLSTSGLIGTHFVSYCISFGVPLVTAASLLSFMGVFNLLGTTASGWLSDRFDNRWLLFWYYLLGSFSLATPLCTRSRLLCFIDDFQHLLWTRLDCHSTTNYQHYTTNFWDAKKQHYLRMDIRLTSGRSGSCCVWGWGDL